MLFDERRQFHLTQVSIPEPAAFQIFVPAFQDVFMVAAGLCVVAFVLSLFRRQETRQSQAAAEN
jgi:hypothetical protein